MPFDLTSLKKALQSFETAIRIAQDPSAHFTFEQLRTIQAGVIQHFEFSYELCWKFIQRWLKANIPSSDVAIPRTRKELFRIAAQYQLIDDPLPWFEFGDARNMTSHIYDEKKAQTVYNVALQFLDPAKSLLNQLEKKND